MPDPEVTLYSVEREGEMHFLTMELVSGQPLDRGIPGIEAEALPESGNPLAIPTRIGETGAHQLRCIPGIATAFLTVFLRR